MAEMQNRKILTLNEVLNLDRRPTLQEMVDLAVNSIEDYTKYLFEKGIIKYVPENLEDYYLCESERNGSKYDPSDDLILDFINKDYYIKDYDDYYIHENNNCIIEFDENDFLNENENGFVDEIGIVNINGKDYNYIIEECDIHFYKINKNGDKMNVMAGFLGYLNQC
jgi:hypothetical protein